MEKESQIKDNSKKQKIPKKKGNRKYSQNEKLIPALKNESRFNRKATIDQTNETQGVKWDNQVIDQSEQKNKISRTNTNDLKTHYPKENLEKDLYNQVLYDINNVKVNDELVNKVILLLKEKGSKCEEEDAIKIVNELVEKYKNLDEESKKTLKNTLMNKYQKVINKKINDI